MNSDKTTHAGRAPLECKVRRMMQITENHYQADDGVKLKREYGLTPNGNPMDGRWVLRNEKGDMVDFDKYRNDLAEHYMLKLETANMELTGSAASSPIPG